MRLISYYLYIFVGHNVNSARVKSIHVEFAIGSLCTSVFVYGYEMNFEINCCFTRDIIISSSQHSRYSVVAAPAVI